VYEYTDFSSQIKALHKVWVLAMDMFQKKMLFWQDTKTIELLKKSLQLEHVSITTTDTIPGFLAPLSAQSFSLLNDIKGRPADKPYLVLIASLQQVEHFVDTVSLTDRVRILLEHCWPGPVTFVFKSKKGLPPFLQSTDGTIALRCPNHKGLLGLLTSFEGLFSSSANKSAQPPAQRIDDLNPDIITAVEYIVADRGKEKSLALPSTVIDVSDSEQISVIRKGSYPVEELERACGIRFKK
jgi:L-threonylcarbamoyladenylate synthase